MDLDIREGTCKASTSFLRQYIHRNYANPGVFSASTGDFLVFRREVAVGTAADPWVPGQPPAAAPVQG